MGIADLHDRARAVLDFWFGAPDSPEYGTSRDEWFKKDDTFDATIIKQFIADYETAAAGDYDGWADSRDGALALIILLDQFPRNMFRGDPRSFATDAKALAIAEKVVARGEDITLPKEQLFFVYLPFEHSEDMAIQDRCLELTASRPQGKAENSPYIWAKKHYNVVAKFGRFPHRNAVLGRENTPEEEEYLAQPGAGF